MIYDKQQIRSFLLKHHQLDAKVSKTCCLSLFEKLGCIQYDPLNITGRNADLVLQSRIKNYSPSFLEKLLYDEKKLVDGWDKMMSIFPASDWPYMEKVRTANEESYRGYLAWRNVSNVTDIAEDVLRIIEKEGGKKSSSFESEIRDNGSWGHRKLTSLALEYLFTKGSLCTSGKKGTHKTYDLAHRVIPAEFFSAPFPFASNDEYLEWYVLRRIRSIGVLWNKNSVIWERMIPDLKTKEGRAKVITRLLDKGKIAECMIEGGNEAFYIYAEDKNILDKIKPCKKKEVRFLAPLDNLLWDRAQTERIFDFTYTWEVYTPAAKRKYGYYVLPILYGSEFAGRFEPAADRKEKKLAIKNFWRENVFHPDDTFTEAFQNEILSFCSFLDVTPLLDFSPR